MTTDEQYRRWGQKMVVVAQQVGDLCASGKKFAELTARLSAADMEFVGKWYTTHVFVALRRLVDQGRDTISFARLLGEIADKPELLSRERFVDLFCKSLPSAPTISGARIVGDEPGMLHVRFAAPDRATAESAAHEVFDELVGASSSAISRPAIDADKEELREACRRFKEWADQCVAHLGDPEGPAYEWKVKPWEFPDYQSAKGCLRCVEKLADKYYRLLVGFPFTPTGSLVRPGDG